MARKYTESAVKTVGASALRILQNHVGYVADIIAVPESRVRFGPLASKNPQTVVVTPSRAYLSLGVKRVGEGHPFRFYVVKLTQDSVTVKGPIDSVDTLADAPVIGSKIIGTARRTDGTISTRTFGRIGDLVGCILADYLEPKPKPEPKPDPISYEIAGEWLPEISDA